MEIRTPFLPLIFLLFAQIISYGQNPIDLINPQVGQQNQYLFFEGTDYCDLDEFENITYTQDTLILTVDELMPNGDFIVSEKLSEGSNSSVLGIDGQSEILYTFNTQNETLTISTSEAVSLFFLYASEIQPVLSLTEVLTNQTFIQGWKTGLSCSFTEYAHGIDQNILGKLYSHLNIFNDDQDFDSDGFGWFSPLLLGQNSIG